MSDSERRTLRSTRTLTSDGRSHFQASLERRLRDIRWSKRDIDAILMNLDENPILTLAEAQLVRADLNKCASKYETLSKDFIEFLENQRTEEAERELASHRFTSRTLQGKVSIALKQIDSVFPDQERISSILKVKSSQRSQGTRITNRSVSAESELIRQRVKLETAKTKLKYAKEEATILRKEAELKVERNIMTMKRELEEAQSGLDTVKEVLRYELSDADLNGSYRLPSILEPRNLVSIEKENVVQNTRTNSKKPHQNPGSLGNLSEVAAERTEEFVRDQNARSEEQAELNPCAEPFVPNAIASNQEDTISTAKAIANSVVKKDVLSSRLSFFDDQPSHYMSWKLSFKSIMAELDTTALEQLDLLTKFLGPASKRQALNIRAANASKPATAVELIWKRLDSRYGTAEILESSIQARLSSFTKLTNQHRKELFELYDLAAEVSALMEDEKLRTTFSYFNSSLGVNRFVCKLPYALQEKWTSSANAYKLKNKVTFPPFTHFVNFLNNVAEMRNDPGFLFDSTENKPPQTDKQIKDVKPRTNRSVSTMKTEVSRTQKNLSDSNDKDIQSEEM